MVLAMRAFDAQLLQQSGVDDALPMS